MADMNSTAAPPSGVPKSGNARRLVLKPLGVNQIPAHPDLADAQTDPPDVTAFLAELLNEAEESDFCKRGKGVGIRHDEVEFRGENFKVDVEKLVQTDPETGDVWYMRRSKHVEGKPVLFEEVEEALMREHALKEEEYTPNLYEACTLVEWTGLEEVRVPRWGRFEMGISQMLHSMPAPWLLNDRVFTVLVISAVRHDAGEPNANVCHEALDMQIPIDLSAFPTSIKDRCSAQRRNGKLVYEPKHPSAAQKAKQGRKLVEGIYVSLEKISKWEEDQDRFVWVMKTASDAGGVLPRPLQNKSVPGAIAKDVQLIANYILKKRESSE